MTKIAFEQFEYLGFDIGFGIVLLIWFCNVYPKNGLHLLPPKTR